MLFYGLYVITQINLTPPFFENKKDANGYWFFKKVVSL